jgi:hypothetical protein
MPAMERQPRPLLDLLLSIVLPSIVLMRFSDEQDLGASGALVVALAFPIGLGIYELLRYRQTNYIAVLGLVSVLLTGGIGLLQLDARWLAIKEAAIPAVLGIAVLVSARLGYPLIRVLLYNPKILDTPRISRILRERGVEQAFELRLSNATYLLAGTFFFSAVMNYLLAAWIVTSPSGTAAFNEELGRLTLLSYPVIAIPSMLMMLGIFWFLWRSIRAYTGLALEEILASPPTDQP